MAKILRKILGFLLVIPFAIAVATGFVLLLMKSWLDVLLLIGSTITIMTLLFLFAYGMHLLTEE